MIVHRVILERDGPEGTTRFVAHEYTDDEPPTAKEPTPRGSMTVRFEVTAPVPVWAAKLILKGDEETENQCIYRAHELLAGSRDVVADPGVDIEIRRLRDSKGRDL
jgi:hypothetical protein